MMAMVSFQGFSQGNTVLIVGHRTTLDFAISVISPEYEESKNTYKHKDNSFYILLKKELDHWIKMGYKIIDSSIASGTPPNYEVIYILVKD